jgi:microcystin-dependent protein
MKIKFSNNASTTLFSTVTVGDTQIVVSPGGGSLFPELTDGNFFMITVVDAQGNLEIMCVTSRNVDTFTVNRAQENTPARAFPEGSVVELRLTAGSIGEIASQLTTDILAATQLPRGIITMWSGATNAVPSGWALCDGNNGTPNLKDRFIVGAGQSYGVGNTGGNWTQTPSVWTNAAGTGIQVAGTAINTSQMPWHTHSGSVGSDASIQVQDSIQSSSAGEWLADDSFGSVGWSPSPIRKPLKEFSASLSISGTGGNQPHYHGVTDNGHAHTAAASAIDVRPPYYALAFIMKL